MFLERLSCSVFSFPILLSSSNFKLIIIADIGVLPSCQEQCSYVGIEMLMHGIPLVGTDAMGISEMIEEGYKIPLKIGGEEISLCTDKLSDSILSALANKGFFGKRARHRFEKYYSLNTMRLKVTQLYNSEWVNTQYIVKLLIINFKCDEKTS